MVRLESEIVSTTVAGPFSSELEGNFENTIRVVSEMVDVIILSSHGSAFARRVAAVSRERVFNAGDGPAQHPTQALLDLYTIDHHLGSMDGCSIALVGNLGSLSVRFLSYFLSKFHGVHIYFISPDVTKTKDDIKEYLKRHKAWCTEITNPTRGLEKLVKEVDVVYMTELSKQHFAGRCQDYEQRLKNCVLSATVLRAMKKSALMMHPLPRANELPQEVDKNHRAAYLEQTRYGIYLRMAILCTLLNTYPTFVNT